MPELLVTTIRHLKKCRHRRVSTEPSVSKLVLTEDADASPNFGKRIAIAGYIEDGDVSAQAW